MTFALTAMIAGVRVGEVFQKDLFLEKQVSTHSSHVVAVRRKFARHSTCRVIRLSREVSTP